PREARAVRPGVHREAPDVRLGPQRPVLRRAGHPGHRATRGQEGLRVFGYRRGHRRKRAVPTAPGAGGAGAVDGSSRAAKRRAMTYITGQALPRRTFLRGIGATIALPLLDAMAPAFAADAVRSIPRLGFIYVG